jgi:hypothetical protein
MRRLTITASTIALMAAGVPAAAAASGWQVVGAPAGGTGARLAAASFVSADDGWAVGAGRGDNTLNTLVQHWDGTRWQTVRSPAFANSAEALTGVSAATADDAWAVGWHDPYGTVRVHGFFLHWNGTAWRVARDADHSAIPVGVDARTPSDVWAVGNDLLEHFDGTRWTEAARPQAAGLHLTSVAVLGPNDAWAVGGRDDPRPGYHHDQPYLAHWDGRRWSKVAAPVDGLVGTLSSVSATSASDVWAVGTVDSRTARPVAIHFDGTSWQEVAMPHPKPYTRINAVVASSATDAWAVGSVDGALPDGFAVERTLSEHWDGTRWSIVTSPSDSDSDNYLNAAAAPSGSAGVVWALGADGTTLVERHDA